MPTLLQPEDLLTLILVSLVLTAWTGGQGHRGRGWMLMGKPHTTLKHPPAPAPPMSQPPLPPGSRAPPWCPVCHETVRT